jgi:S-adenosylmethionine decarboxylase proenzyme
MEGHAARGTHLLFDAYEVGLPLETLADELPLLEELVREMRLTVVAQTGFQFEPIGYTYAFVLSESHFTIHTYPESHTCFIDIFCCSADFDPVEAVAAIGRVLQTKKVRYQVMERC